MASLRKELEDLTRSRQQQLDVAEKVHRSLLPKPVRHPLIEIDIRYVPVEHVGGDYCQVVFASDKLCYITMCDVSGHGVGPALMATRVSSEVRRLVMDTLPPKEIVARLNGFFLAHFTETNLLLSFFVAQIDLGKRLLTYSGAGHPAPLLIRRSSDEIEELVSQNLVIGVIENSLGSRPEDTRELRRGDRLLFCTDGLHDAMDEKRDILGSDGLSRIARQCRKRDLFEMADCVLDLVGSFRHGEPRDDITVVIAEIK